MLKIRSKRIGKKGDPSFRVVVVDSRQGPKSGKYVEKVGFYNPKTKENGFNAERITYWMSMGAQTSPRIHNMLVSEGIIKGKKINVLPKKSPIVSESEEAEEAPEAAPAKEETPAEEETVTEAPAEEAKEEVAAE